MGVLWVRSIVQSLIAARMAAEGRNLCAVLRAVGDLQLVRSRRAIPEVVISLVRCCQ